MSQIPYISIIIPIYNVEKYLKKCIDSILCQSFKDFELLLIDDGSPDNSGKICDDYALKDKRIKVFHKKNGGVSSARNLGINESKGKWICFIDADDWIEKEFCETLRTKSNDIDLIFFTSCNHYNDGCKKISIPKEIISTTKVDIENTIYYLKYNSINYEFFGYTWNKLFKSQIIKQHNIKFIEGLSVKEDEIFTTIYCRYINSIYVIPQAIYNYRVLETGLTAKKKLSKEYELLADKIIEEIPNYKVPTLIDYEYKRGVEYYFKAIDISKSTKETLNIISKIKHLYKDNNNSIKIDRILILKKIIRHIIKRFKYLL